MRSAFAAAIVPAAMSVFSSPGYAQAGWSPGAEIIGQPVQVTTNGVTNTIYLDAGGSARIMTPAGRTVAGGWTAANNQLCLTTGATQECFPYAAPFHAGTPVTLTSSCRATSTWLAASTNPPTPPVERGERGK